MGHVLNIHEVNQFSLDPYQRPEANADEVVVKVRACGICGSDLSYIKNGGIHRQQGGVTPLGHEAAGEVLIVGKNVSGFEVGQPVIINPMLTSDYVGSGGPQGAFTEELVIRGDKLHEILLPIPAGIPYEIAAMTEPLAVAMHGVNRMQVKAGDKVVVFGCGPIGLGMILWLVDRGITDVVALDLAPERRERAMTLGARVALDPTKEDLKARLLELHGKARVFSREAVGTDAFIDAAGAPGIISDVIRMAKFQSRLVVTAAYLKPVQLDIGAMLTTEMTLTTAVGYPTEFPDVVAAMPRLRDKIASIISHRYALKDVMEAFGVAATPQSAKVMININDEVAA